MSIIFNPKSILTLTADVLLHPSQLNNDLYDNLKSNLSRRLLHHCYKNYGYISNIFNIVQYDQGQIFNEDTVAKVQYKVKFNCEVIRPVSGLTIIASMDTVDICIGAKFTGLNIFIDKNQISDKFIFNQNNKIIYKQNGYILKKGDLIKVKILNYNIYHYNNLITVLGYIEDLLTEQEINNYYSNVYDDEMIKKRIEVEMSDNEINTKNYNSSRLTIIPIENIDKKYFSSQSGTLLSTFEIKKDLIRQINKLEINTDLATICDFINFLTPFAKFNDIVCICIKPYINDFIVKLIKKLFANIEFEFYTTIPFINTEKYKDKKKLLITDVNIPQSYLKELELYKYDMILNNISVFSNDEIYNGDIIILPFTYTLRLYGNKTDKKTIDCDKIRLSYINYFNNYNNTSIIYDKFYSLFKKFNVKPTFNNIIFYKLFRYYYKFNDFNEEKEKTIERVSNLLEIFD
jgi:DNA-directed RNA polymerase subunit E'/Rpb7